MSKTTSDSPARKFLSFSLNFLRGSLIGIAEIIPGVSGGTIALITGVYDRVINSASNAVRGILQVLSFSKPKLKRASENFRSISWSLLVPMLIGMFVALFVAAGIVEPLLESYPSITRALFAGLIIASLMVPIRLSGSHWKISEYLIALASAAAAFSLASIPKSMDAEPNFVIIAASAALAVCALVLPGVSGSYLLLALGMYAPTLAAVNDRDFGYLATFVLGAIIGLGSFVGLLQWLLKNRRRVTLIVMTGLMAGSLRALWPWQDQEGSLLAPTSYGAEVIALVVGAAVVISLIAIENAIVSRTQANN